MNQSHAPLQIRSNAQTHLNLVDIKFAILFLQFLVRGLHSINRSHRISQVLSRDRGLFHVERLLLQLTDLTLVQLLLFQHS